jgi:transcription elongation factor GreA
MFKQTVERLEKELKSLEKEYRHDLPKEIKKALAMGDLRENAEYHAALERQSLVKAKIGQLKKRLAEIAMIKLDALPKNRIGLGSSVQLFDLDADREVRYELVFAEEADPANGLISISSPLGRGLQGRKVGEEVEIRVPSGLKRFEITALRTVHDRNPVHAVKRAGDEEA